MTERPSATVTRDQGRRKSVEYPADGKRVALTVTDAGGAVWTLTVPGHAVGQPVTITMTALARAESARNRPQSS